MEHNFQPLLFGGDINVYSVARAFHEAYGIKSICYGKFASGPAYGSTIIDLTDDPDVLAPLRFLREREIVHFQRFGEALDYARDYLKQQHYFFMQKNGCNS